jgi:spore coat protein CotF
MAGIDAMMVNAKIIFVDLGIQATMRSPPQVMRMQNRQIDKSCRQRKQKRSMTRLSHDIGYYI